MTLLSAEMNGIIGMQCDTLLIVKLIVHVQVHGKLHNEDMYNDGLSDGDIRKVPMASTSRDQARRTQWTIKM